MPKTLNVLLALGFLAVLLMQLSNHFRFPWQRGFDASAHLEYVSYIQQTHSVPEPNMGWEHYQPPLYYFISALASSPQTMQFVNFIAWIILLISIAILLKSEQLSYPISTVLLLTASLPVGLYLSHTISNELWSAAVIAVLLIFYHLTRFSTRKDLLIGSLLAVLSVLSKATAWIAVGTIIIELFIEKRLKTLVVLCFLLFLGSGWFYGRNLLVYGNPFVASIDFAAYQFSQPPGYRDVKFFIDLSGFFKADLFQAHWYSFIPGTYFSWFWDGHNVIIPIQPNSKIGVLIFVWSLPIFFGVLYGSYLFLKIGRYRMWLVYALLLIAGYAAYNIKLPFYSTVKASFIASLIPMFSLSFSQALQTIPLRFQNSIGVYLLLFSAMIIYAFTIRPWWY